MITGSQGITRQNNVARPHRCDSYFHLRHISPETCSKKLGWDHSLLKKGMPYLFISPASSAEMLKVSPELFIRWQEFHRRGETGFLYAHFTYQGRIVSLGGKKLARLIISFPLGKRWIVSSQVRGLTMFKSILTFLRC